MPELATLKDIFQILSSATVLIGFPIAIYQYIRAKRREQFDREYQTYNSLDDKYMAYQKMCLENPELDIFDYSDVTPTQLTDVQEKKQLIAFTMLISLFERAYILYNDHSPDFRKRQWTGWEEYIEGFCKRKNFVNAWERSGEMFDTKFQAYMDKKIEELKLSLPQGPEHLKSFSEEGGKRGSYQDVSAKLSG